MRCIYPFNIKSRVFLCETKFLGITESLFKGNLFVGHPCEDVIACTVEDAKHIADFVPYKTVPDGPNDRDTAAHRGFEAYFASLPFSKSEKLIAFFREKRFVGGNDPFTFFKSGANKFISRMYASYELHYNMNIFVLYQVLGIPC